MLHRRAEPSAKYHVVAEEGVPLRDIAEVIGQHLKIPVKSTAPEEVEAYFGWLALFAGLHVPASSEQTRKKLGCSRPGPAYSPISNRCASPIAEARKDNRRCAALRAPGGG